MYYNLAISYYRQGNYTDAETHAVSAIKLDPKHASSQRVYAMTTYAQKKLGISLLAWSNFLILEPQTQRSVEAYKYVQNILNYGIIRKDEKNVSINFSPADGAGKLALSMAVLAATIDKKNLTGVDSLKLQLTSVFKASLAFSVDKKDEFYSHYYADYFSKLAATDNMEALTYLFRLSVFKDESLQWFKDNNPKLSALDAWVTTTKREF